MTATVTRVGEPELVHGPRRGSLKLPNEYKVCTTPLPPGPHGANWRAYFSDQLKGPLVAYHDGIDAITVYCHADDYPDWLKRVDAAIEQANEQMGTAQA